MSCTEGPLSKKQRLIDCERYRKFIALHGQKITTCLTCLMFCRPIVLSSSDDEDTRPGSKVDEEPVVRQSSCIVLSSSDEETHNKVSSLELAEYPKRSTALEQLVIHIIQTVLGHVAYCTIIIIIPLSLSKLFNFLIIIASMWICHCLMKVTIQM